MITKIVDFEFKRRKAWGEVKETLLSCAVYNGSLEVVKLLREKQANPSFISSYGENLKQTAEKALQAHVHDEKKKEKYSEVRNFLEKNLLDMPGGGYRWKFTNTSEMYGIY